MSGLLKTFLLPLAILGCPSNPFLVDPRVQYNNLDEMVETITINDDDDNTPKLLATPNNEEVNPQ
jgi:hypothetical protein